MFRKKEWIAMLLAGGQGSRLYALTRNLAKPAVPFGGKYRIIDFPLSNCVNSGIDTVGVLTQYQPLVLNDYLGNGEPWDLDRSNGGVHVLPPYQKSSGSDWYRGTANAIYQNINFIDRYQPEYVAILSGDHIYKMDYSKMLRVHKEKGADCTIAVLDVPLEEASRFGIMSADEEGTIYDFEEKPKEPKSTLASMGVYIFSWECLRRYLTEDEADPKSSNDFGKNIIPKMLAAGQKMVAYPFDGYWKDVGTIDSLWEANMDLLNPNVPLVLGDADWKIYSRNPVMTPHFVHPGATVQNSMITEGCEVAGVIDFSVLFAGVTVQQGAIVRDSIVMPGAVIEEGAVVEYAIIGENAVIGKGARVGVRPENIIDKDQWGIAVIAEGVHVGAGAVVAAKAMVDQDIAGEEC
ncbi:glucose-1-phosphate adenylyltransferase [Merdimmobilis hominis]|jgi:glucose-1-phosphate adenylyltransferase|uniref:Glucose-1-phosphate adenylyltransferase n=1 Tax=uncultured Anaerotruncus sp. TaxID=905011 RepID=A0A6N2V0T0_9FIRM|nr:glucose-1-phosphate adenylyltransferase [Merdimmobilis hominis]MCD4837003.1 glucose-1-phosphate adenylyltransferase [Merdimmobilis hominis]PWL63174.1 MAG: glucose-1-phosphate adenylyltransferase [Oscillospiraceae bacterium]